MNTTSGSVEFGGRLAYCQHNGMSAPVLLISKLAFDSSCLVAWIQNATLRENILFGQLWDEHRYWQAVKDASLVTDLEILPDGDLTEVCNFREKPLLLIYSRQFSDWRER